MQLLSAAWTGTFALVAAAPAVTAQQVSDLSNGLQVLVVENHAAPVATVLVAVHGGAAMQRRTERGLAHLLEHMLFRAYGDGRHETFGGDAARLDGWYNGTTSDEVVDYFVVVPSENAIDGIGLVARLLMHPQFRPADLRDEREVVLDELERHQSDPEEALQRAVSRQLWGAAWHRRDVGGDSLSLMGITAARLLEAYGQYYAPDNTVLIVTGDVIPDDVFAEAERAFGRWRARRSTPAHRPSVPLTPLADSRVTAIASDVPEVTIRVELQGPGVLDDAAGTYATDALCEILSNRGSPVQARLVGSGLFRSLWASYVTLSERGPIRIVGTTAPERAPEAVQALLEQIDRLGSLEGIEHEDLLTATRRREVDAALEREAEATLAPSLASLWAAGGIDYYLTYRDRVNAVTLDDLRRVVMQYVVGKPRVVGVMGPKDAVADVLESLQAGPGEDR